MTEITVFNIMNITSQKMWSYCKKKLNLATLDANKDEDKWKNIVESVLDSLK